MLNYHCFGLGKLLFLALSMIVNCEKCKVKFATFRNYRKPYCCKCCPHFKNLWASFVKLEVTEHRYLKHLNCYSGKCNSEDYLLYYDKKNTIRPLRDIALDYFLRSCIPLNENDAHFLKYIEPLEISPHIYWHPTECPINK